MPALARGQMRDGKTETLAVEKDRLFGMSGDGSREAPGGPVALQDFTIAAALSWKHDPAAGELELLSWPDEGAKAGRLSLLPDRSVVFRLRVDDTEHEMRTRPVLAEGDTALNVVASIQRNPRQALAGVWVNGVEAVSVAIPPGAVAFDPARLARTQTLPEGCRWRRLDFYTRAFERWEVIDWGLLHGARPPVANNDVNNRLVVLGGSEAMAMMEEGTFEAAFVRMNGLAIDSPSGRSGPRVRSLAWEGDTVFQRERPMNFGSLRQQLLRNDANAVLLMFGRQECLERGATGVDAFKQALTALVDECREMVGEVWLAGLPPFEKKPPPLPDLSARNPELATYDRAIREVAAERDAVFIDLRARWPQEGAKAFTTDGVNLNASGARLAGRLLLAAEEDPMIDKLRPLARAKNKLWESYRRPTNWAFLHGDRTAQPSSRDHLDPSQRWFPSEMEEYQGLIQAKEQELWKQANELGRKLP